MLTERSYARANSPGNWDATEELTTSSNDEDTSQAGERSKS